MINYTLLWIKQKSGLLNVMFLCLYASIVIKHIEHLQFFKLAGQVTSPRPFLTPNVRSSLGLGVLEDNFQFCDHSCISCWDI